MDKLTRRDFLKLAGTAAIGAAAFSLPDFGRAYAQAPVIGSRQLKAPLAAGSSAKVYFTKHIDAEHFVKLYELVNSEIYGKVAIKMHTGEIGGKNFLPREFVKAVQQRIPDSNIVETNTLYKRGRHTTELHCKTIAYNGWDFCPVDIMDEFGNVALPVRGGKHFKGHASGGFGGSLKNIAIGCADAKVGKAMQHGGADFSIRGAHFMEHMVEAGKAVTDFFGKRIAYVNVMRRMSVRCDCAGPDAEEPTIGDIGMVASTDLLAIDQACVDMVYDKPGGDNKDLIERIESREGLRQLSYMKELKMGNPNYELISID